MDVPVEFVLAKGQQVLVKELQIDAVDGPQTALALDTIIEVRVACSDRRRRTGAAMASVLLFNIISVLMPEDVACFEV